QDSIKRAAAAKPIIPLKSDTAKKTVATVADSALLKTPFGAATIGIQKFVTLENKELRVKLSTQGGRVYSIELKNYKTADKKPLILFDGDKNQFGLLLNIPGKNINTNDLFFTPSAEALTLAEKDSSSLTMRLSYSPTQYIDYIYSLNGTGFKLGLNIKYTGLDNVIANSNTLNLDWASSLHKQEKDMKQERQYSTVYYFNTDKEGDWLSEGKDDQKTITDKKMQWVGFKQHFFSSVLIAKQGIDKSNLAVSTDVTNNDDVKQMKADLSFTRGADGSVPLEFYFGPNRFSTLKAQGYSLEKEINLGWGPLKYINRFAVLPVFNFLKEFNLNYGLIILALTVVLKLVLSPLTYKSYLSMAKMRILKPEMDEIKANV